MFPFPFVLMGVAIAVVAVVSGVSSRKDQERTAVWRRWALARNWAFHPDWASIIPYLGGGPFGPGHSKKADRGFEGNFDGLPVFGMRYRYTTGAGKNRTTWTHQVLGIRLPGATFPPFTLRLESFLTGRDVQFENEDFNRRWSVKSHSRRFAHDIIHPRMMEFLLGPTPDFDVLWFHGDMVLTSRIGDPDPRTVDAKLRMMTTFVDLIPSFVMREVGSTAPTVDRSGPGVCQSEQEQRMAAMAAAEAAAAESQQAGHASGPQWPHPSPTPLPPPVTPPPNWPGQGPWRR